MANKASNKDRSLFQWFGVSDRSGLSSEHRLVVGECQEGWLEMVCSGEVLRQIEMP